MGVAAFEEFTVNEGERMKPVRKVHGSAASRARHRARPSPAPVDADQARLAVAEYCLFHYPTLFTAGVPRSSTWNGTAAWTVPIVLTHPNQGVIGEAGEPLVDGRTGRVMASTARAGFIVPAEVVEGT